MEDKIYISVIAPIFGAVIALCVYIWTRTISEYDKMISGLFTKSDDHEKRLSHLEGEHEVNACKKIMK